MLKEVRQVAGGNEAEEVKLKLTARSQLRWRGD
jgi:hypothetical protein